MMLLDLFIALAITNSLRDTPVTLDAELTHLAFERAEYLCTATFSHDGFPEYVEHVDYRIIGENLARNTGSMANTYKAWQASPSHYQNLMKPAYTKTGIGISSCGTTVQLFSAPMGWTHVTNVIR